jgi:hypothetical protein
VIVWPRPPWRQELALIQKNSENKTCYRTKTTLTREKTHPDSPGHRGERFETQMCLDKVGSIFYKNHSIFRLAGVPEGARMGPSAQSSLATP